MRRKITFWQIHHLINRDVISDQFHSLHSCCTFPPMRIHLVIVCILVPGHWWQCQEPAGIEVKVQCCYTGTSGSQLPIWHILPQETWLMNDTTANFLSVCLLIAQAVLCLDCHEKFGPPENGPLRPCISKYLDPWSRYFETFGPPWN